MKPRDLLSSPDAYATTLVTVLIDKYGTEAMDWAPETIRLELEDDFNIKLPLDNSNKLMAGIMLLTSDRFYKSLPDFITLCNVLAGDEFDPRVFDPASAEEMAWAITEALLLAPPEDDEPFTKEIRYYIGEVLDEEGLADPPDVLRIAMHNKKRRDPLNASSNDPLLYESFFSMQQDKSKAISGLIKDQLRELLNQLESLKLDNGDTSRLMARLGNNGLQA